MMRGGANLVERQPVFSADGKTLLICTTCTVSVYSVSTGLLVSELHGHTAPVTSISIVRFSGAANSIAHYAWTSSMDGTVKYWDITTGAIIKSISIGRPILSMVVPNLFTPVDGSAGKLQQLIAFLLVQWSPEAENNEMIQKKTFENGKVEKKRKKKKGIVGHESSVQGWRVILHNLTTGNPISGHLARVSVVHSLVCSPHGRLVGLVESRKIWVWRLPKATTIEHLNSIEATFLHHTKALQALAFDPTETMVAGCDDSGRILVWKNVGESSFTRIGQGNNDENVKNNVSLEMSGGVRCHDDAASLSTYHWHADKVNFLLFSADGTHLLSGGKEAVVVLWQLETSKRHFLPRLGAPLLFIAGSQDSSIFSISCADNTIKIVNVGTMAVEKCIQGIKPPVHIPDVMKNFEFTRIAVQPHSSTIALPAENLNLQFYDVLYDQHIVEIQTSPRNYVSAAEDVGGTGSNVAVMERPGIFVTHVTFSSDCSVMATAELRIPEDGVGGGSSLKFWKESATKMQFSLSTQVDEPHSAGVAAFVYHPISHMAVSCSQGGEFKVWIQVDGVSKENGERSLVRWKCQSVGSYQNKPMSSASFSPDGTLLAVAADELVTLWNPTTNGLVCVLASSPSLQPIRMISFVPNSSHLIAASWGEKSELTVWNLEALSIQWSYAVKVEAMAVDPKETHFAILATSNKETATSKGNSQSVIAVFDVNSPFPRAIWSVCEVAGATLFFLSLDSGEEDKQSRLVFMNKSRQYVIFNPFDVDDQLTKKKNLRSSNSQVQGSGAFEDIYGKASIREIDGSKSFSGIKSHQPLGDIFNAPSHVLPPLTKICFSYLESLLERRTNEAL